MTTSSAPGKVYLFGEHAVVYGEPAVLCAIERRARVTAEARDDDRLRVQANDLTLDGFTVTWGGDATDRPDVDVPTPLVEAAMSYIESAVAQASEAVAESEAAADTDPGAADTDPGAADTDPGAAATDPEAADDTDPKPVDAPEAATATDPEAADSLEAGATGFDIAVESDIPLGAGLGSSAAVVVACIDAATRELGIELEPAELADRAYRVEHDVQDGQASRADTFCSTMGGTVRVQGDDCRQLPDVPNLPFVVGYDGGAGDTGELVAGVRDLREEYGFAGDTLAAIGDVARSGDAALHEEDLEEVGRLMDFNHGLLSALGVSARSLDAMVWAAREADALGAKLTGAGGGGCIVALDRSEQTHTALEYTPGCEEAFRAELDTDGVRVEDR